jgi:hypothetical protein
MGQSPGQLAVIPIMADTAIPICPTDTAALCIIVVMATTAAHIACTVAVSISGIEVQPGGAGAACRVPTAPDGIYREPPEGDAPALRL